MQTHELIAHPDHPPVAVRGIVAKAWWDGPHWLRLRWRMHGTSRIVLPALAGRRRADGLWQTTCFELFVAPVDGNGYSEFNFSPSNAWAAYDFDGYRAGMNERTVERSPVGTWRGGRSAQSIFDVALPRKAVPDVARFGMSAVIEEIGGTKSYWAIRHPPGQPDFHHADCFAGQFPPPVAA